MGKQVEEEKKAKHAKTKVDRFGKMKEQAELEAVDDERKTWKTNAAIYLGHLPQGFEEEELRKYFQQYGDVLAVKLCRSKKTGRSKGFGFIQFRYPEVAKIAAEAMNNYMILGKFLRCHTLEQGKINPFRRKNMLQKTKFINWKQIFVIQKNRDKTQEEVKKQVQQLLDHEEQKRSKLREAGISYEFPGFRAILNPQ